MLSSKTLLCSFLIFFPSWMACAATAQIEVHPGTRGSPISPLLFGVGIEWTGNGDGLVDSNTQQLRQDLLNLLAPLNIPVWRFPGGILSDYYNWQDGIGPESQRPVRQNPMDGSSGANTFGTDELIQLCKTLKSDVLITANYGSSTLSSALAWQAYFVQNGLPAKYWEIGNEIYLTEPTMSAMVAGNDARIFKTSAQYAADFPVWANALRGGSPNTMVGAIAGTYDVSPQHVDWMHSLIGMPAGSADFVALHDSFAPMIMGDYDFVSTASREAAYTAMYAQPLMTRSDIGSVREQFAVVAMKPKVAITEHYPLFASPTTTNGLLEVLDQTRTLGGALYTASELQTFMSMGVWMANFNLANSAWYGALIYDGPNGPVPTPTYYVYDLYRNHFGTSLVAVSLASAPQFSTAALGTVPPTNNVGVLQVLASVDAKHTYLSVINHDLHNVQNAAVSIDGRGPGAMAEVRQLANSQANVIPGIPLTTSTSQAAVSTVVSSWKNESGSDVYAFPPNSLTIFKW